MLINCVAYQDGKRLAEIQPEEIHRYLAMPGCFVWVALLERDPQVLEQMQAEFDLHPLAVEDARQGHQRPKIHEYDDSLFAVMHLLEHRDGALHVGEIDVFAGRNYILTIRTGAEQGFADVRARCEREPEMLKNGSGYVLYALMDAVVDRYFPILDSVETALDAVEERIFADTSPRENVQALYLQKQDLVTIRHAVAPLQDGLKNLYGARVPVVCSGHERLFPRRRRAPAAPQPDHRLDSRHDLDRDFRQSVDDQPPGKRDDEAARGLRRADCGADDDRRHIRHELRVHAGTRLALRLCPGRSG